MILVTVRGRASAKVVPRSGSLKVSLLFEASAEEGLCVNHFKGLQIRSAASTTIDLFISSG